MATQRLLEAVRDLPLQRFVFASSSSVYGPVAGAVNEEAPTRPYSPYGVTKLAAESLATAYARNFGVPVTSLRLFTVYGPRQRPDMAIERMILATVTGLPFDVYGDGSQVRAFTYVDDVVDAAVAALRADLDPGAVLNISGGTTCTLNEVIAAVGEATGRPVPVRHRDASPGDVGRTDAVIQRALDLLGWKPRTDLAEGIDRQFAEVRRRLAAPLVDPRHPGDDGIGAEALIEAPPRGDCRRSGGLRIAQDRPQGGGQTRHVVGRYEGGGVIADRLAHHRQVARDDRRLEGHRLKTAPGRPSTREGTATTSAATIRSGTSVRTPRRRTESPTPSCWMAACNAVGVAPSAPGDEDGEIGNLDPQPRRRVDQHVETFLVLVAADGKDDRLVRAEAERGSHRLPSLGRRLAEHVSPAGAGNHVDAVRVEAQPPAHVISDRIRHGVVPARQPCRGRIDDLRRRAVCGR